MASIDLHDEFIGFLVSFPIQIHESEEAALQKAFPKPAAAAKRALASRDYQIDGLDIDKMSRLN